MIFVLVTMTRARSYGKPFLGFGTVPCLTAQIYFPQLLGFHRWVGHVVFIVYGGTPFEDRCETLKTSVKIK